MKKGDFHKQETLTDVRAANRSFAMPKQIGPYKIESLLNQGGMSTLYLGLHPETNQPIAIKVLLPKYVNNQQMSARFLKEAEIIRLANHPHIVKLYGQGNWENGLYIAMEFIRGISLSQFIQKKSLSVKRALEIILQVAYALSHLHAHGVIHRDLKPENILIDEKGEVKVIDFGIAQLHEEKEKSGVLMGTPVYMSPEQREHPNRVQPSSDLYSLGVIAYELIVGRLSHGAIHLESLSKPLRAIIGKALEKDVKKRYEDVVDFINDITQYLQTVGAKEEDRAEEIIHLIQKSGELLLQKKGPHWATLNCGIAWQEGESVSGLYLEFFQGSETRFAILFAEPEEVGPTSLLYGSYFRGMARVEMQNFSNPGFRPVTFFEKLNKILLADRLPHPKFSAALLVLDAEKDQLVFISCQGPDLSHISEGTGEERIFKTSNPRLGAEPNATFVEVVDNWRASDTLLLHNVKMEKPFGDARLLSAQHQAEKILEKSSLSFSRTALALCLQRIF